MSRITEEIVRPTRKERSTVKFFKVKKEEKVSILHFRDTCVKERLEIIVSRRAVRALHLIAQTADGELLDGVSDTALHALSRRGFVREDGEGAWTITELGLLTLAYAEAGNLLKAKDVSDV